jgi:alpha-D-xyloside xylohydrolase
MAESLRGGLSLCQSGFGFWSHDIGGFEQTASADVYKRWCAFGLLSSHSRLHGSGSYRVPWLYDEEAVDVLRFFTKLKCRLMPYLFGAAYEAHELGVPVMRAMMLEFPEDLACDYLDRQYMLGDSLLVAPIFSPNGKVDYYLPEGRWTNFLTGQVTEGGKWVHETHGYMSLPLMVKPNTIIPVGANEHQPDYDLGDGVTFHVFELQDGATTTARVTTIKGEEAMMVKASRKGQQVRVQVQGEPKPWSVLIRGVRSVQSVEGGITKTDTLGTLLIPKKGASLLTFRLPAQ